MKKGAPKQEEVVAKEEEISFAWDECNVLL